MLWTRILGQRLICIDSYNLIRRANLFGGSDTIELLIRMLICPTNLSRTCSQNPLKVSQLLTFLDISRCFCDRAKCRGTMYILIVKKIILAALGWQSRNDFGDGLWLGGSRKFYLRRKSNVLIVLICLFRTYWLKLASVQHWSSVCCAICMYVYL